MSNHIFEENPPAQVPQQIGGAKAKIEKQARQLLYDARYQVKKETGDKQIDPVNLQRLVTQRIDKSTSIPAVKTRAKQMMNMKEEYIDYIKDSAAESIANTLYKVFVEKKQIIELPYLQELAQKPEEKFKVTVYDPNSGTRYVRMATRKKMAELRLKGLKVERTEYGETREKEAKKGETTAAVLGGGKKAKKDYDHDGNIESPAKEYRGVVHNAIQRKKGLPADGQDTSSVKEDFFYQEENIDQNTKKIITGKGVNNTKLVKVFPDDGSSDRLGKSSVTPRSVYAHKEYGGEVIAETGYKKFLNMLQEKAVSQNQQQLAAMAIEYLDGNMPDASDAVKQMAKMGRKDLRKFAKTKHKGLPVHKEEMGCDTEKKDGEEDPRSMKTKVNLVKNKLRAMGLKMSYEPKGDLVDEAQQRIRQPSQPINPRGTYDPTGIGVYPRTEPEKAKMRKGKPVQKYPSANRSDDHRDDSDHPSLTARERNPNLR
ncbi:MAG: DUF3008 family protein [Flavobacteriales bacterium]|nr:DUF3008 family protein [Flavobacteriales bacterium]